jgi:protease-4
MSEWPPKPPQDSKPPAEPHSAIGQEWKILEKTLLASIEEQRRTRRWGILFKLLTFAYLIIVLLLMNKSCSSIAEDHSSAAHLAMVDIQGTIASDVNSVNSQDTNKALKRAFEASGSKAVVLNINSPGGSPVQSDEIWQEIRYLKHKFPQKKVYAVIGDTGASGAYYIASAADQIYVNPSSIVGSIGVIMPNYGLAELAKKLGVEDRTLTSGDHKALLSMTKPMNPNEKAHVQALLDNVHQHFIDAVKAGRGTRLQGDPKQLFSGLYWTGEQAIQLGLADKTGNLSSLARELRLNKSVDYTVQHNALDALLNKIGTSVGQGLALAISQQLATYHQANVQ